MRFIKALVRFLGGFIKALVEIVLILGWVLFTSLRSNPARKTMRPLIDGLGPTHPKFLAKHGSPGGDLASAFPWYRLYLTVDRTPDLEETVRSVTRDAGFHLDANPRHYGLRSDPSPTSSRLFGERDGSILTAVITRDGPVTVNGHGPTVRYGRRVSPPAGKAILSLFLQLPSVHERR